MNLSSEDIQRYTRIALQWLAAYLVTRGAVDPNASWIQPAIGFGVGLASFIWTVYGNKISAKIAEIQKMASLPEASKETKAALVNVVKNMSPADQTKIVAAASPQVQIAAVVAMPEVKGIVTDAATATAAPSNKVVSVAADIPKVPAMKG